VSVAPNAQGIEKQINDQLTYRGGTIIDQIEKLLQPSPGGLSSVTTQMLSRLTALIPDEQKAGVIQREIGLLNQQPETIARDELIMSLNQQLEQLTRATDENTSATSAMTDVLSPFYTSDPRRTHLGFRAFAGGGIMTADGMLPLRQYDGGGVATSPQVSVFGEGSTPEAYVPVPSGRIPVEIKRTANTNARPVVVNINIAGNADPGTVNALKKTAFQQAQSMRRALG